LKTMRSVSVILFACGIFFALFVWMLIPTPIAIFLPWHRFQMFDIILSISGSILAVSGYFIWIGWILFAVDGRYAFLKYEEDFQVISIVHHVGWLAFFPYMRRGTLTEFAMNLTPIFMWIVINILIAVCAFIYFRRSRNAY